MKAGHVLTDLPEALAEAKFDGPRSARPGRSHWPARADRKQPQTPRHRKTRRMSNPSKSKPSPKPSLKLCAVIFPFAYGGVGGVNVFFVFLLLQPLGFAAISPPHMAALITLPLSIPATWLGARWIASLIAEAERTPGES